MDAILVQFQELYSGIGVEKIPPIQIYMYLKEGAKPVAQKQRIVPGYMMKPLRKKLDEFLEEGVIEGPLESKQAWGWAHNIALTKKMTRPRDSTGSWRGLLMSHIFSYPQPSS